LLKGGKILLAKRKSNAGGNAAGRVKNQKHKTRKSVGMRKGGEFRPQRKS